MNNYVHDGKNWGTSDAPKINAPASGTLLGAANVIGSYQSATIYYVGGVYYSELSKVPPSVLWDEVGRLRAAKKPEYPASEMMGRVKDLEATVKRQDDRLNEYEKQVERLNSDLLARYKTLENTRALLKASQDREAAAYKRQDANDKARIAELEKALVAEKAYSQKTFRAANGARVALQELKHKATYALDATQDY